MSLVNCTRLAVLILTFANTELISAQSSEQYFRVTNLKYGLMRERPGGQYRVYEETERIPLVANGVCSVAGTFEPCVWNGLEFNYQASQERSVLHCVETRPSPGEWVTASEKVAKEASEMVIEIPVEPKSGFVSWPGYTALSGEKDAAGVHTFTCTYNNDVVIDLVWEEFRPEGGSGTNSASIPKVDLRSLGKNSKIPVEDLGQ